MLFSQLVVDATNKKFDTLLSRVGEAVKNKIESGLSDKTLSEDVIFAIKWLYAHSPISDMANCDFDLFKGFASHGIFLRQNSPYAMNVPEDIFLHYVLFTRMGSEEICDCRKFFYDLLKDRIKGSTQDAILEINYWNAENVMYRSTDFRTLSAIGTFNSAYGRCGEEAVLAVNVYRSLGIPARQVSTPRWAHCDDNHAWVEVWCDGKWHFLGACEPEEVLDKAWFTNAAGRAMIVQSIKFGETDGEDVIRKVGPAAYINCLDTYAKTKKITVLVKDEAGQPVSDARVVFGILNNSHIFPCANIATNSKGEASLICGYGSLNVRIIKGDIHFDRMIFTPDADKFEFVLKPEQPELDKWIDFVSIAPGDGIIKGARPTEAQKELGRKKTAAANAKRESKVKAMFDENKANAIIKKYGYGQRIYDLLKESRGNFSNICAFLEDERFSAYQKEELLFTLAQKDWRDIDTDVLCEALEYSKDYAFDKEILYPYIICPRVWFEHLAVCRAFIMEFFDGEQKTLFRRDPIKVWQYVQENINFYPDMDFGMIITKPKAALTAKVGSPLSKKVLFVTICRTLGVPARLNPVNELAEFYQNGHFTSVETLEKGDSTIILQKEEDENYQYLTDFTIGVLDGCNYRNLDLDGDWEGNKLTISVKGGFYRILTDNRLPNGNIYASQYLFELKTGESKTIKLHKHHADLSEMLFSYALDDFKVYDEDNTEVKASELVKDKAVLMWLDEGTEPTEHILNEMLDAEAEFKTIDTDIIFMVRGKSSLENAKLNKVVNTFGIKVFYDSFAPNVEVLARRLFLDPEKLPLIIIADKLNAVYASSGYNVGSGEMIRKICKFLNQ